MGIGDWGFGVLGFGGEPQHPTPQPPHPPPQPQNKKIKI